ncbi:MULTISPECIES: tRNA (uridine(34)/cytosine(34)/5-carboxymethylaminomethyluridine(34)-2'-O)-methyltransferase TrmL [unclassified Granulicatella]|uniref:tRNA (uridine(34)/cytosine(34)/5- carboxymethylaminomethyluridine(34)-2'-O)- methyltransferase TrmL n=1 Tax=unclassified Granulicatella TaxID=2630493 RepID=UPI0010738A30|nr:MULTISPECIES: tRNA (uridine(34)/cytosine(34)/5-carboxymethylaminomethyluridine(34)-2'-O)-methyltransferase TrmL [unclassified Granulicatella]MBF0781006.1 tRNA (uridine(34)/cytosine(34)/5-carboxymethylaminomethyluridine(34)-2'-O)-methyltransferase TrmL [Granulicatella sp. 19428wC4_WM01]TFU92708.1 tRNA (uridine(34)/cytosine(34)/5-carboxymethylaminomethyluridine(34)-2'-O)-methyltransferase TrmL [Granulicatella sp. WM01]
MTNHIVLFEPQIPANTGNIARTCAGTNAVLHLIKPLGFSTDDKQLKRAGLDYWHDVSIVYHDNLNDFLTFLGNKPLYLVTKFAKQVYSDIKFNQNEDNFFIFGKETTGLPEEFMKLYEKQCIRIPMNDEHVRSLNLSNTVAIVLYEALRQQEFIHLERSHTYNTEKAEQLGW